MNAQLLPVTFAGSTLFIINQDNHPFVPMRPVVEGMGLDWKSQFTKLKQRFATSVVEITTPTKSGAQSMVCLPLSKLAGWMYSISPNKVKPELREKVVRYQTECDQVLFDYWTTGVAVKPHAHPSTVSDRTPLKNTVNWAVHKTGLSHSDVYTMVHNYFGVESVSDLTDEQIPQAVKYLCEVITTPANQPTLTEILPSTRYLLTKAHNGLGYLLQPIAPDANMVHDNDIAFHIENNMPRLSVEALASIITTCTKRMQRRMEWSEMRIKSLKTDNPQLGFFA